MYNLKAKRRNLKKRIVIILTILNWENIVDIDCLAYVSFRLETLGAVEIVVVTINRVLALNISFKKVSYQYI